MATYKISIYDRVTRITSDSATCQLPAQFSDFDALAAAGELLLGTPYRNSDAADAIDGADDISTNIVSHSDGWDGDTYRVDLIRCPDTDEDGDGEAEVMAIVEIERPGV